MNNCNTIELLTSHVDKVQMMDGNDTKDHMMTTTFSTLCMHILILFLYFYICVMCVRCLRAQSYSGDC